MSQQALFPELEEEERPSVGEAYLDALPRITQKAQDWGTLSARQRKSILQGLEYCQPLKLIGDALGLNLEQWRELDEEMDRACTKAEARGRLSLGIDLVEQVKEGENKTLAVRVFEMLASE